MSKQSIKIWLVVLGTLMVVLSNLVSGWWVERLQDQESDLQSQVDSVKDEITSSYNLYTVYEEKENHNATVQLLLDVSQNKVDQESAIANLQTSVARSRNFLAFSTASKNAITSRVVDMKKMPLIRQEPKAVIPEPIAEPVQKTHAAKGFTKSQLKAEPKKEAPAIPEIAEPRVIEKSSADPFIAFHEHIDELTKSRRQLNSVVGGLDNKILLIKYLSLIFQLLGIILILIKDLLSGD